MNGQILQLGIGILLLFWGRKLFWLFVGVVGFLSGIQLAPQILRPIRELQSWLLLSLWVCWGLSWQFLFSM